MKIMVGIGLCVIGIFICVVALFTALVIGHPNLASLGVIIGGAIIMSGIVLICLPNRPIRVPYFDQRP
jgi:hypothetical protein